MGPKKKRQTPSKFHEEASDLDETFSPVLNKSKNWNEVILAKTLSL